MAVAGHGRCLPKDLVDDVREGWSRVNHDARAGNVFLRPVESDDEIAFRWLRAPFTLRALVEAQAQGIEIEGKDEDLVEQVDESGEVPRPAAQEGGGVALIGHQCPDSAYVPDVVLVQCGVSRYVHGWWVSREELGAGPGYIVLKPTKKTPGGEEGRWAGERMANLDGVLAFAAELEQLHSQLREVADRLYDEAQAARRSTSD